MGNCWSNIVHVACQLDYNYLSLFGNIVGCNRFSYTMFRNLILTMKWAFYVQRWLVCNVQNENLFATTPIAKCILLWIFHARGGGKWATGSEGNLGTTAVADWNGTWNDVPKFIGEFPTVRVGWFRGDGNSGGSNCHIVHCSPCK